MRLPIFPKISFSRSTMKADITTLFPVSLFNCDTVDNVSSKDSPGETKKFEALVKNRMSLSGENDGREMGRM